ncbi:MAG: hypothetical protein QOE90_2432 [Thermoplasmata archaeon]|jgi:hypothetical protein|nr:hypothetical protein [Thermoplasmata archaeon]
MHVPVPAPRFVREEAPEAQAFVLHDGRRARSLAQLVDVLAGSPAALAAYHREHFAPWLRDVVGDEPLARRFDFFARQGGDPDALRETLVALGRARVRELDG